MDQGKLLLYLLTDRINEHASKLARERAREASVDRDFDLNPVTRTEVDAVIPAVVAGLVDVAEKVEAAFMSQTPS